MLVLHNAGLTSDYITAGAMMLFFVLTGAYLVIGIDKMTLVNQAFGHEIADSILLSVSERLDRCLRSSDVIGRVGGDRFGAVLTNCPESELTNAAEKILETARTTVVETPSGPSFAPCSSPIFETVASCPTLASFSSISMYG